MPHRKIPFGLSCPDQSCPASPSPHLSPVSAEPPAVDVLLSVYNGFNTIDEALNSIHQQTWQNFSVVLVNDGSTDRTAQRLRTWQNIFGHHRCQIITNQRNLGLTRSLNVGLRFCTAPYVARLDADDIWHPDKLIQQMKFLRRHPDYGLVGCWYMNTSHLSARVFRLPVTNAAIKRNIWRLNPFGHSCVVVHRQLLTQVGGYNPNIVYSQDRDLWFRLYPLTSFYNVPAVLCQRQTDTGLSQTSYRRQMWSSLTIRFKYLRLYRASLINYLSLLLPLLIFLQPRWVKNLKLAGHINRSLGISPQLHPVPIKFNLAVINDRPLLPHRGETIARRAMAQALAAHPSLERVSVINTTPFFSAFIKLPRHVPVLYLRCGALAAALIALRNLSSYRVIILEVHNFLLPHLLAPSFWLYRFAARRVDLFITIDPQSTASWLKLGASKTDIIELPSGVPPLLRLGANEKNRIRTKYGLPLNHALALYSGNLYRDRSIELIMQAAFALRDQPIHFALAGGASQDILYYRRYLSSRWPSLSNLSLLGLLPYNQVLPLLSSADLILVTYSRSCPTINTMSPLKLFEAQSSGTPILAADLPRLRALSGSYPTTFYNPDDSSDLTRQISNILRSTSPPLTSSWSTPRSPLTWSERADLILKQILP